MRSFFRKQRYFFLVLLAGGMMALQGGVLDAAPNSPSNQDDSWDPSDDLEEAGQDLKTLLEKFLERQAGEFRRTAGKGFNAISGPAIDVKTTPKELIVECEIPGWDKKDIAVELKNNTLVIRGKRGSANEQPGETYYVRERWVGDFERTVALPVPVFADRIKAEHLQGVLVIHMTRQSEEKSVRVRIN